MPNGTIELDFGDGSYPFCIAKHAQIFELQEKCGAGPNTIFERLRNGTWFVNDFRETIRLGLIGAGMESFKALTLVRRYVDDVDVNPWRVSVLTAAQVLFASLVGVPDDPVGKRKPERAATGKVKAANSPAPMPTGSAPRSASRRGKSTK